MAQPELAKWLEDFGRDIWGRITKWLKKYAQQCEEFSGEGTRMKVEGGKLDK